MKECEPLARILIVEDEPLIASMLADWLIELGHEPVGPAARVAAAFEFLSNVAFDAAIVDVNLRGQRTDFFADALLERGLPVVFATGASTDSIGARFASCSTLSKPYRFADVEKLFSALPKPLTNPSEAVPGQ